MLITRPLSPGVRKSATCPAAVAIGDLVYVSGGMGIGEVYEVDLANPSEYERMPSIAVVLSKPSDETCVIQFRDEVRGIYSGLTTGRVYFCGEDGRPTLIPPAGYVQSVGVAVDPGVLRLEPAKNMIKRRL